MNRTRNTLIWIWLATAGVVAALSWFAYRSITRIPDLAGRTDPARVWNDPALVFTEPGILGTAVEIQVTDAVRACMAERGFVYRGPAVVEEVSSLLDPARDGYGVAAGGGTYRPTVGNGGAPAADRDAYETALYGAPLADGGTIGYGCSGVGEQALSAAIDMLDSMPYSIDQLEANALADPVYVAALGEWSACMARRGYTATSPDDLIRTQVSLLASSSGDAARALADEERRLAAADFACRRTTLDPATREVAERLGPGFVEANRPQLEALIPSPSDTVDLPEGLGTGDVQVTLIWTSRADLDLYVTDPSSETVYYNHRTAESGGTLDRDANYPCNTDDSSPAAENVYWPTGGSPDGSYVAKVRYTSDCGNGLGAQSFDLVVKVGGRVIHNARHTVASPGDEFDFEFRVGAP